MAFFLFLVFIIVPIAEIATFIQVGSIIGLPLTLAGILFTALAGAVLVRQQGFKVLSDAQASIRQDELPVEQIIHGVFILIAGLLLITPGFITDMAGFLLLIPPFRLSFAYLIWKWISKNSEIHVMRAGRTRNNVHPDDDIIDVEAVEISESTVKITNGNDTSPWKSDKK